MQLLPRFSIRWVLLLISLSSAVFVVVRQAFLGQVWAMAFTATVGFVIALFLLFGGLFLAAYAMARATRMLNPADKPANPFIVEGQFPPQMVPKSTFGGEQQ